MMVAVNIHNERTGNVLAEVLAAARQGDDAALEQLIEKFEPRIYALARAIVGQPAWAEDATQDTLLQVLQKLPTYSSDAGAFETWVLCIARNTSLTLLRKRRVRGELDLEQSTADAREQTDSEPSPSDLVIALEDAQRATAALDRLPSALREIVVLRYFADMEPAEIARVVGDSAGNVRVRLFRAIRELRTLLAIEN